MIALSLHGCNGGIGGLNRRTTCYGIGENIVIDAGTGLATLPMEKMAQIDHVVLTHAHLDHIACLPLMLDSVAGLRQTPVTVWASDEVITLLRAHVFNEQIWPDFSKIPTPQNPFVRFSSLSSHGATIEGHHFLPLPAAHGIPACGYLVSRDQCALAFSGDTGDCPEFWESLQHKPDLKAVIVECSYPAAIREMAELSMHMYSNALIKRISSLPAGVASVIVHRKPGFEEAIAAELMQALPGRDVRLPSPGECYRF